MEQALPGDDQRRRALVVRTSSSGDWSTYTLRLVGPGGSGAPAGIDLPLSAAPFTFTVDCPSDLDCAPATEHPPRVADLLPGDYLARDYEALRSRLLDRLATLLPDWTDRNPADPAVMLVELFAALGDRLAYWQDAVAVEAYLGTARRRTSVRRHARLLDYTVHEGCSARTLLAFTTDSDLTLPRGTPVTDLPVAAGGRGALARRCGRARRHGLRDGEPTWPSAPSATPCPCTPGATRRTASGPGPRRPSSAPPRAPIPACSPATS